LEDAIKIREKSVEIDKALYGEQHIDYGGSLMNLANSLK
jgi:hypothetical protein